MGRKLAVLMVAGALTAAGCGGGDGETADKPSGPPQLTADTRQAIDRACSGSLAEITSQLDAMDAAASGSPAAMGQAARDMAGTLSTQLTKVESAAGDSAVEVTDVLALVRAMRVEVTGWESWGDALETGNVPAADAAWTMLEGHREVRIDAAKTLDVSSCEYQ